MASESIRRTGSRVRVGDARLGAKAPVVDIHAHYVSRALIAEVARYGDRYGVRLERDREGRERLAFETGRSIRPFFAELCDLELRLPLMDAQGVDRQVISTWTDLAGYELPAEAGGAWARLQNETLADAARHMPGRFEAMATLPLQDVRLSLDELDHAVRNLGMRSVELGTSVNGRDLDDGTFRPLWKRLCDLDVLVLLHPPLVPIGIERLGEYFLNNLLGNPMDTTVAAARLIFSGVMRDYPGLKCCLAHGGGFLPYQIGRLDRGFEAHPACRVGISRAPSAFLRSFYYDTLTHAPAALEYLAGVVTSDRLLFGSDYPFEMRAERGPAPVHEMPGMSSEALADILGRTAARLLDDRRPTD
jgi:aminocarboxymuconate-semialdehyde decarboxylase